MTARLTADVENICFIYVDLAVQMSRHKPAVSIQSSSNESSCSEVVAADDNKKARPLSDGSSPCAVVHHQSYDFECRDKQTNKQE